MGGIRRHLRRLELTATGVVERLHQLRITGKAFRGGDIFHPMLFPQPVGRTEGTNA
ncbi:hypothetical protein D3C79_1017530 [compost metagenome]